MPLRLPRILLSICHPRVKCNHLASEILNLIHVGMAKNCRKRVLVTKVNRGAWLEYFDPELALYPQETGQSHRS